MSWCRRCGRSAPGSSTWRSASMSGRPRPGPATPRGRSRALVEDTPNVVDTPFEPVVIPVEEAHRHSVAEHIAELRRQREKTHALIEVMKPADFDRTATHPAFGTL